jgi:defective in cullin neddylation protein 1
MKTTAVCAGGRRADPDADEDLISSEGALSMLQNLGIDPASVAVLPLSYYLDSPALGQFARAAYVDGWLRLGVGAGASTKDEVLAQQRAAVSSVMESFAADGPVVPPYASRGAPLLKKGLYTTVYEYTFVFARSEGQKNLGVSTCPPANAALELALTFWDLLLPHAPVFDADGQRAARGEPSFSPTQFDLWKRFLTEASGLRVISKDTWNQFLEFMHEIDPDFAKHDFEAAWPSVIDEFVDWVHSQRT